MSEKTAKMFGGKTSNHERLAELRDAIAGDEGHRRANAAAKRLEKKYPSYQGECSDTAMLAADRVGFIREKPLRKLAEVK